MGYTHYWSRPQTLPRDQFDAWRDDVLRMVLALPATTRSGGGEYPDAPLMIRGPSTPEIINDGQLVAFNGAGTHNGRGLHHEDFWFAIHAGEQDAELSFCKTAAKPYDLAVCAALCLAELHFRGAVTVESDGTADDWLEGAALAKRINRAARMPKAVAQPQPAGGAA